MSRKPASRVSVPPSFFPKLMLPFFLPAILTLVLMFTVGESWPRNIAPGSGLKLWGFGATAVTALLAWRYAIRGIADPRAHKMAAAVCGVVGLMGWPIWSIGILPSINGVSLGPAETVRMTLERTETSQESRSRRLNHWAYLAPANPDAPVGAGRYFIAEDVHDDWNSRRPRSVSLTTAEGLLGAQVVTAFE